MLGIGFLEPDGEAWLPGVGTPRGTEPEPPWKTTPSHGTDTQTGLRLSGQGSCQGHRRRRNNPGSAPSTAVTPPRVQLPRGEIGGTESTGLESVLLGLQGTVGGSGKAGAFFLIRSLNLSDHNLTRSTWVRVETKPPCLETAPKTTKAT